MNRFNSNSNNKYEESNSQVGNALRSSVGSCNTSSNSFKYFIESEQVPQFDRSQKLQSNCFQIDTKKKGNVEKQQVQNNRSYKHIVHSQSQSYSSTKNFGQKQTNYKTEKTQTSSSQKMDKSQKLEKYSQWLKGLTQKQKKSNQKVQSNVQSLFSRADQDDAQSNSGSQLAQSQTQHSTKQQTASPGVHSEGIVHRNVWHRMAYLRQQNKKVNDKAGQSLLQQLQADSSWAEDEGDEDIQCPICMERDNGIEFHPCFHRFCLVCALAVRKRNNECPLCRGTIKDVLFLSSGEVQTCGDQKIQNGMQDIF
eukprot:TRINITY_DN662_c0_g1_i1.p2 TRINITY_DN662_c0_g1~~TRINITY_DN662_c0_g1_i1.p2  ORF type:complete len:309 (-),score=26.97 TRINITY_DN662_c0_g1_i1:220-1146(-)